MIVADDGSRDGTAAEAERGGRSRRPRLPRRGKGQALTLAERAAPAGPLLLCDADLVGDLAAAGRARRRPRDRASSPSGRAADSGSRRRRPGSSFAPRAGFSAREPLSGQRALSAEARDRCFPLAAGFGCEVRMTIDAARAGLEIAEIELPLSHQRDRPRPPRLRPPVGRQLLDAVLACGPLGRQPPGPAPAARRLGRGPARRNPAVSAVAAAIGLADDLWSGPERGFRAHLRSGRTTGVLKLVGIPLVGLVATRKVSGALLVGLAANSLNQLDTRPGRALKAYLAGAPSRCVLRSEAPSSSFHTIFARRRCWETQDRTRWARC